jgi:hypothetical protein
VEKTINRLPRPKAVDSEEVDPWVVWPKRPISPETQAFLMRLDAAKRATEGAALSQREAEWGRRLSIALEGLDHYRQYRVVAMYARRQVVAESLGREHPYTADLDAMVSYRVWKLENQGAYECAVATGIAPAPLTLASTNQPDKDVETLLQEIDHLGELVEPAEPDLLRNGWSVLLFDFLYPLPVGRIWDLGKLSPGAARDASANLDTLSRFWAAIEEEGLK